MTDTEVRRLRKQAGLTQEEAAAECDVPLRTFADYDRGETDPPSDRMDHIRRVLGNEASLNENLPDESDEPLIRYSVASDDSEDDPEIVVDPRILTLDRSLPDPNEATAHYVSGRKMGPWMRDRQYVLAEDCSEVESTGRYVVRWGEGERKVVIEAHRHGNNTIRVRNYAPRTIHTLRESSRSGDVVVYEREDGTQITIEVLGRILLPQERGKRLMEEVTNRLSKVMSGAQLEKKEI